MSFRVSAMVAIPGPRPFRLRAPSIRDPNTAGPHLKAPDPALTSARSRWQRSARHPVRPRPSQDMTIGSLPRGFPPSLLKQVLQLPEAALAELVD